MEQTYDIEKDREEIIRLLTADIPLSESDDEDIVEINSDDSEADPDYFPQFSKTDESLVEDEVDNIISNIRVSEPNNTKQARTKKSSGKGIQKRKNQTPLEINDSKFHQSSVAEVISFPEEKIMGKNGFIWNTSKIHSVTKTPARNIVCIRPGPTPDASHSEEPVDCFNLFFSEDIMSLILLHTNAEIEKQRSNYKLQEKATFSKIELTELKALFGLIILAAALKNNHLASDMLFDSSYCGDRYISTMSKERFNFLINCLRFDSKACREKEKKFAPITEIWEILIKNCRSHYKPGAYVTIDEQLVGFRGKCPFRMYIPSKPGKYGIKIVMMCDNTTKYMVDALPYLGKGTVPDKQPAADYFVKKLVSTIRKSNRNVTMDNWFTSVPLVQSLLKEDHLTVIGTIKKNKREFPEGFVDIKYKDRATGTSLFLYNEDLLCLSYKPKANKLVTLVSSAHLEPIINEKTLIPQIVSDYNKSKGAVDTFDQMCHNMNCGRKTRRWPLCMFYNMINIASINSFVIFSHNTFSKNKDAKPMSRLQFMLNLHRQLVTDWQIHRLSYSTIPSHLRSIIENNCTSFKEPAKGKRIKLAQETSATPSNADIDHSKGPRKYCSFCSYKKRRLTVTYCRKCQKAICGEHQFKICNECGINFDK